MRETWSAIYYSNTFSYPAWEDVYKRQRYGRAGGCQIYGGIAQLGEHLPCKQGVKGSNPFISIDKSFEAKLLSNVDLTCAPAQQELLKMSSVKLACR